MHYRNEIDGLRAIAVLSVVLYHAGITILPGGFVGVDIFFVISGYLITSIIHGQIVSSSFSFSDFYWRRFRRILPALFFMIFIVGGVCYKILDPILYKNFGTSVWTTALFSSNIYFWTEAGYFQKAAELKPLLHTWSLGVEEQYYILFPFLMILIKKSTSNRYIAVLTLVGAGSLLLSIYGVYYNSIATFYLLPTRLWELLLGSLLAVSTLPTLKRKLTINLVSWSGFAMLVMPILFYSKGMPFPGITAILPCLGTALIIWALKDKSMTSLKSLLSLRPVVFIGKVSYSFYLWHWPTLVLYQYYTIDDLPLTYKLLALFTAFLISCFSWQLIEKPFREKRELFPKVRMLMISFSSIVLVTFLGAMLQRMEGFPSRFNVDLKTIIEAVNDRDVYVFGNCGDSEMELPNDNFCNLGIEGDSPPEFVLWGDSHAGSIAPVFDAYAKEVQINGVLAFINSCPPLLHVQRIFTNGSGCSDNRELVKKYITENLAIKTVILMARWGRYVENKPYGREQPREVLSIEYNGEKVTDHYSMVKDSLQDTIIWLKNLNKNVVIIMPVPEIGYDVPVILSKIIIQGSDLDIRPTFQQYFSRQSSFFDIAKSVANNLDIKLLYPHDYLCNLQFCNVIKDGKPLYFDTDHLSIHGAMQLKEMAHESLSQEKLQNNGGRRLRGSPRADHPRSE